jgi:hypothetical protein
MAVGRIADMTGKSNLDEGAKITRATVSLKCSLFENTGREFCERDGFKLWPEGFYWEWYNT